MKTKEVCFIMKLKIPGYDACLGVAKLDCSVVA